MRHHHPLYSLLLLAEFAAACTRDNPNRSPADLAGANELSPFAIAGAMLPDGRQGEPYNARVTAIGQTPAQLRWSTVDGALPPGLSLGAAGEDGVAISGTPAGSGTSTFTLAAQAADGSRATHAFAIRIDVAEHIEGELVDGTEGQPYAATLTLVGGTAVGAQWSVASGALPPGLQLAGNGRSATLSGSPAAGSFAFSIVASDSDGARVERAGTIRVRSSLRIDGDLPAPGVEAIAYAATFQVHGGTGSGYHWQSSGALPPGISLTQSDATTLSLSGTPTTAGSYSFAIKISDATGGAAERSLLLAIAPRLQIVTAQLADGLLATAYSTTLSATGGSSGAYQWSVDSGSVPPGLTLLGGGATATLSGTPSATGTFDFSVAVSLAGGERATRPFRVVVGNDPPRISTTTLPGGVWSVAYAATVVGQSAVSGPVKWAVTGGELPPGVTLAAGTASSATLTGTPRQRGLFHFTISMSDAGGAASADYTIEVAALPELELLARVLESARVGRAYAARIAARGAQGAVTWRVDAGQLPPGLTLVADGAGAIIAGTPTQSGWYPFTARVTDAAGTSATQSFAVHTAAARWWSAMAHTDSFDGPWTLSVRDVSDAATGMASDLLTNVASGGGSNGVSDLLFSPNPDWLSFTIGDLARKTLYLADLRGAPTATTLAYRQVRGDRAWPLSWSPDGARFDYVVEPTSGSFQFTHSLGDTSGAAVTTTPISATPCQYAGAWSPDGNRFAVASADGTTIYIADGASTRSEALPASVTVWRLVGWTPDSASPLFVGNDKTTEQLRGYALDLGSNPALAIALTPAGVSLNPNFLVTSADGGSIAVPTNGGGDIYVVDVRSRQLGVAQRVNDGVVGQTAIGSWSPDSQRLLLVGGVDQSTWGNAHYVLDRDQIGLSPPVRLADGGLPGANGPATWTPDGARLTIPTASGVFAVPTGSGQPEAIVTSAVAPSSYDWLGSGSQLFVYSSAAGLAAIDMAAPAPRVATPLDDVATPAYFAVAHERRAVFYYRFGANGASSKLWMADLSTAPIQPVELLDFANGVIHYAISDDAFVGSD